MFDLSSPRISLQVNEHPVFELTLQIHRIIGTVRMLAGTVVN